MYHKLNYSDKELAIWSDLREAQVESEARVTWGESVARETHVKSDYEVRIIVFKYRFENYCIVER